MLIIMPKIDISAPEPADKSERATERAIKDLMYIQEHPKMYINEKKQMQQLIYFLHELNYYDKNNSLFENVFV